MSTGPGTPTFSDGVTGWGDPAPPAQPNASFIASPSAGFAPLTVRFIDTSTGIPTDWYWDFGDGSTSTEQNPVHIYATGGTYHTTLTTSNRWGTSSSTLLVSAGDPLHTPVPGVIPLRGQSAPPTDPNREGCIRI